MRQLLLITVILMSIFSCKNEKKETELVEQKKSVSRELTQIEIEELIVDDSMSIRGLEIYQDSILGYAANNGFGYINLNKNKNLKIDLANLVVDGKDKEPKSSFRSLAIVDHSIYALTIGNPAIVYGYSLSDSKVLGTKYEEHHEKVFYDAMDFWNEKEGLAIGDPTENCMSIIITRDGGNTWVKIPCDILPETADGEAAFAASDTNISIKGNQAWIISGGAKSRVYHTPDKGNTWEVFETPLIQGEGPQGGYSMDFFDENNGFIIGGDYTQPEANKGNKARTRDGGKTWELVADGKEPDYRSCVQYIPNGVGNELVTVGFRGISYSNDSGETWKKLSEESFFTIRFLNDSVAYASGRSRIAKLTFR